MTGTNAPATATAFLVGVALLGLAVPGAAVQTDDAPSIDTVATNGTDGNLTLSIRGSNLTEVDVTGVPDGWEVVDHEDDFGVFADQLANESRVVWLWRIPVSVNLPVTFSVPEDPSYDLGVVPWSGTDQGEPVAVDRGLATPTATPGATATTAPPTAEGGDTGPGGDGGQATPTELRGVSGASETTTADGPGFGALGVLTAGVLAVVVTAFRRN